MTVPARMPVIAHRTNAQLRASAAGRRRRCCGCRPKKTKAPAVSTRPSDFVAGVISTSPFAGAPIDRSADGPNGAGLEDLGIALCRGGPPTRGTALSARAGRGQAWGPSPAARAGRTRAPRDGRQRVRCIGRRGGVVRCAQCKTTLSSVQARIQKKNIRSASASLDRTVPARHHPPKQPLGSAASRGRHGTAHPFHPTAAAYILPTMMLATSIQRAVAVHLLLAAALWPSSSSVVEGLVSTQCADQYAALRSDTALRAAYPTGVRVGTTTDFTESNTNYSNLCIAAGGQFATATYTVTCVSALGVTTSPFLKQPFCYGGACTSVELVDFYNTVFFPELISRALTELGLACSIDPGTLEFGATAAPSPSSSTAATPAPVSQSAAAPAGGAPTTSAAAVPSPTAPTAAVAAPAPAAAAEGSPMANVSGGPAHPASALAVIAIVVVITYCM